MARPNKLSATQIKAIVDNHFHVVPSRSTASELAFVCTQPGCGDVSGNRSVNLKTGLTSCWRCNKGGPLLPWLEGQGISIDPDDIVADPGGAASADELAGMLDKLDAMETAPRTNGFIPSVALPRGFTPLTAEPDSAYAKLIGKMAVRKGLTLDDFMAAGVGFTREHLKWEPYAIFPVHEWGRPVYYQGRTYVDIPGESTKRFPNRDECPLGSRYWVEGIDELRSTGGVAVVVEAMLSRLSLKREFASRGIAGFVPLCVFKHSVSTNQLSKILACRGLAEVVFMYDSDSAHQAHEHAGRLSGQVTTSVVELPDVTRADGTVKKQDPNDNPALATDMLLDRRPADELRRLDLMLDK